MARTADCVIIGGGAIGCAAALRLAQAKLKVVVVERTAPGAEASTAAAGILAAQEASEGPGPLARLLLDSRALFRGLAAEIRECVDVDIGYRETGVLSLCFTDEQSLALRQRYAWQETVGLPVRRLTGADVRAAEPAVSETVMGGLCFPDDGQVEPKIYVPALALAAARAGAVFESGVVVRRIVREGDRVLGVETTNERIVAPNVVLAAGSWSGLIEAPTPIPTITPVRGQIVELETRAPLFHGTLVPPTGGYVVARPDGRVLCGSTLERVGFDKNVTAGGMRRVLDIALTLVPALAHATVRSTWANLRPTADDQLPILGASSIPGLVFATGHYKHGILLSPVTAEIVRDLVLSGRTSRDVAAFSASRFQA